MKCSRCGHEIHPLYNFCNRCGAESPKNTIFDVKKEVVDSPIYCPHCGKENWQNSLFCSDCGENIYEKPQDNILCPTCKTRNSLEAVFCSKCGTSFKEWFNMTGSVARKIGYRGSLTIHEKMTDIYYHFLNNKIVTLGRKKANTITIPCSWVSGNHCYFDLGKKHLIDDRSSNGTFINRSPEKIKTVPYELVSEFNIAGSFTFKSGKNGDLYVFKLGAILDEKECRRNGDGIAYDKLRKQYFILLNGDGNIYVRKADGHIDAELNSKYDYYQLSIRNGFYYYSDITRKINDRLILKDYSTIPQNWEILDKD